jgi:hypothetical protein
VADRAGPEQCEKKNHPKLLQAGPPALSLRIFMRIMLWKRRWRYAEFQAHSKKSRRLRHRWDDAGNMMVAHDAV